MVNAAGQFSGSYGNGKGRAMKGDKMDKSGGDFKGGKFKAPPKGKKRKSAALAMTKKTKKKPGAGMPAMMSDADFGAR